MSCDKKVEIVLADVAGVANSIRKSFVLPGYSIVSRGNTVRFYSDQTDARIIFPNETLFDKRELQLEAGKPKDLTVNMNADVGVYSYAVITYANNDLATGGSFPKFIVDSR